MILNKIIVEMIVKIDKNQWMWNAFSIEYRDKSDTNCNVYINTDIKKGDEFRMDFNQLYILGHRNRTILGYEDKKKTN